VSKQVSLLKPETDRQTPCLYSACGAARRHLSPVVRITSSWVTLRWRSRYSDWLYDRRIGVRVTVGSRIFYCLHHPDRLWGTPNHLSNEYTGALSSGGVRREFEADHTFTASDDVKKTLIYTLAPPHAFMA
jgi:hypothetical protein